MLEIKSFIFGPFETNCYVVSSFPSGEDGKGFCLIIDPACSNEYEQQQLLDYINSLPFVGEELCSIGLPVAVRRTLQGGGLSVLATHAHLDHLWGAQWATEQWHTPVLMHEADIPMAETMQLQYHLFDIRRTARPFPIDKLTQSSISRTSSFAQSSIILTPGHTPGSVCLYFPEEKVLFSGDTLFRNGYGRTDLPGGDFGQLVDSLNRLFALPPDTRVFPGHGDPTTIAAEISCKI